MQARDPDPFDFNKQNGLISAPDLRTRERFYLRRRHRHENSVGMVSTCSGPACARHGLSAGAKGNRTIGPQRRIHNEAQPVRTARRTSLRIMRRRFYDPGSGCRSVLVRRGRGRIQFPIALLDPPRADMALHRDADMVWAIVGTCRVKFLSGFAGGHGKNTLAQA